MAVKRKPISASTTAVLDQIKAYTEFESVTISPDGTISVKFAERIPALRKKEKEKPIPKTAIDSLSETPPVFEFGKN